MTYVLSLLQRCNNCGYLPGLLGVTLLSFWLLLPAADTGDAPYGHVEFTPTSERPLGWRGDGTGAWTGATPVRHFDTVQGKNLVWQTPMPAPGMNVPLVVGEKVFALADPNLLLCCDVHTGKILWQTAIDHTAVMDSKRQLAAREAIAWYEQEWEAYSRFRLDLDALYTELRAAGCTDKDFFGKYRRMQNLADTTKWASLPADLKHRFVQAWQTAQREGYDTGLSSNEKQFTKHKKWKRLGTLLREYSYHTASNWYGWVTRTYASPCTDGEFIYVQTNNHAVACVDFHGQIKWLIWDRPDPKRFDFKGTAFNTRFAISPLLYKQYFVIRADSLLRCYDKRDGTKLWEIYPGGQGASKDGSGKHRLGMRQDPEATHHCVVEVPVAGGATMPVVVDVYGQVVRLADGVVVNDTMPRTIEYGVAMGTALPIGGHWYASSCYASHRHDKSKGLKGGFLYRLTAPTRDRVEAELRWNTPGDFSVLAQGQLYGERRVVRASLRDGQLDKNFKHKLAGKYTWSSIGGSLLVRGGSLKGQAGVVRYGLLDVQSGTMGQGLLRDRRMHEDPEWRLQWAYRGSMGFINGHAPSFQANRMFIRTMGYLFCIGDATKPFPVAKRAHASARLD